EARPMFEECLRVWRAAEFSIGVAHATSSLGRVASRSGDFARADELYSAARKQFRASSSENELIDTDARIAEALVFQGEGLPALELTTATLDRSAATGGAMQDPLLRRIRGYAIAQLGDVEAAHTELRYALDEARSRKAQYEAALTLDAIARVG